MRQTKRTAECGRRKLITSGGMLMVAMLIKPVFKMTNEPLLQKLFHFKDDGVIPNSTLPLILYQNTFSERGEAGAQWLETKFASNKWTNSWRWGVYPFHHYHSNTHEVLGVFRGFAELQLGGAEGQQLKVKPGDVIIIPAGVGHKCLSHSEDFTVVGAYPDGIEPDLNKGQKGERPKADDNIKAVTVPDKDPLLGENMGLVKIWG